MPLSKDLAIDLGTSNSLVYIRGQGIVLTEPSVVAINTVANTTIAVGAKAKKMIGRTPPYIRTVKPIKNGVIADLTVTDTLIRYLINTVIGRHRFFHPRVIITTPSSITSFEERTLQEAAVQSGAREALIIEAPLASAIGSGIPVFEPRGRMIVDIGGGTTDIAVLALGGIVTCVSIPTAGEEMDEAIIQYVKNRHRLLIGEQTAEEIKILLGHAVCGDERALPAGGRGLVTGISQQIEISSREIQAAIHTSVLQIVRSIKKCLEQTPPELASDIIISGICLSGGGSLLPGIDTLVGSETGVAASLADNPLESAVLGAGKALEDLKLLHRTRNAGKARSISMPTSRRRFLGSLGSQTPDHRDR